MAQFSIQQKSTIDNYRRNNNLSSVLSDDAVAELIKKEMESKGIVYAGFESLTSNAKVKSEKSPTIFGTEYVNDEDKGLTVERTAVSNNEIQPTQSQSEAIEFLDSICSDAETVFENRQDEAGVISKAIVNFFTRRELKTKTVKKEIQALEEELKVLDKASKGELTTREFLGDVRVKTFEEAFKQLRGVEFNEENISDCSDKAQQFAGIKSSVDMINQLKELIDFTTRGDVQSQLNPQDSSAAILKAFQMSGINSLDEMNKTLKDIEEKYQNHPDMQKYGKDLRFAKNKQGKYVIYRTAPNGYPTEATNEQLKLIAKEMGLRLDKALASALGIEFEEDATAEEIQQLTQQTVDKYKAEYEESFKKAYGKKDVKALAEAYVEKQQKGVANFEMGLNIASMALMMIPGGVIAGGSTILKGALVAKNAANAAGKVAKGIKYVNTAKNLIRGAEFVQRTVTPILMANMTLRPTELLEQLTSKNGMSAEEWENWGVGVLQNSVYMAAGIGASKLAETGAALFKTKALISTLKSAGKSGDEIIAMVKANPVKFPNEIVKSLTKVDKIAKTLQISSEAALDISSTIALNKAMGNGDLLPMDVINSIVFAISGGLQQFAHLSTESKKMLIQDTFKDYGITRADAENILKAMDMISEGKVEKVRAKSGDAKVKKNSTEIKPAEVKHTNIDFKNDNEFLLSSGFSDGEITTLKEKGIYEAASMYLHLYKKYLPGKVKAAAKEIKSNLAQNEIGKIEVSEYSMKNFDEIVSSARNAFKNMDEEDFIELVLEKFLTGKSENIQKTVKLIQEHPEMFQNTTNSNMFLESILDNLANTTDEKLLAKKIETVKTLAPNCTKMSCKVVDNVLQDNDGFEYKYNVMKSLSDNQDFDGRLNELLYEEPSTIDLTIKNYDKIKDDPKLVALLMDDVFDDPNIFDLKQRLYQETGITDKISNSTMSALTERIKDDVQMQFIKELYEQSQNIEAIESFGVHALNKISNNAQKDAFLFARKHNISTYSYNIDNIKYDWQTKTAQKMIDNGISPYDAFETMLKNTDKDVNEYINRHIEDFKDNDFAFTVKQADNKRLKYMAKYDGTMFEYSSKYFEMYRMEVIDKLDEIMKEKPDFIPSESRFKDYIYKVNSETKAKFIIDILNLNKYENLDNLFDDRIGIIIGDEKLINNIYTTNLLEKTKTEHLSGDSLRILADFNSEEVVDKILSYHLDKEHITKFCAMISKHNDAAKAQFEFLDDILKAYPDYIQETCGDGDGFSDALFYYFDDLDDTKAKHKWFNNAELRNKYSREDFDSFIKNVDSHNKDCINEILNHPKLKDAETLRPAVLFMQDINADNSELALKLLKSEDFSIEEIQNIIRSVSTKNAEFADKVCFDKTLNCPKESIPALLNIYAAGCDDIILDVTKQGLIEKQPNLLRYSSIYWENIIKRDLLNSEKVSDVLVKEYAQAKNEDIVNLHKQLVQDAIANKDLLKPGLEDITDKEIKSVLATEDAVRTVDLIGLGNTEAAFPLMLDEFQEFMSDVEHLDTLGLTPSNCELLRQKINPQQSQKYKQLNDEITAFKKILNKTVGDDNLARIKELQDKKAEIDEQIKQLKQSKNAETPEVKQQIKDLQKQSKVLGGQAQSIYYQGENAAQVKAIMQSISTKQKEMKNFLAENSGLEPQEVVTKLRVLAALSKISTKEEMADFINMIKVSSPENDAVWNDAVNKKIFQKLGVEYDEALSEKLDLIHCKYISKLFISSGAFFKNMKTLVNVVKDNPDLTVEQAIDKMPQNIETKRIFEELGFDYEKFTKVDKNSYTTVELKLNAEEAKQSAIHNLEEDLNDSLFQSLPKEVTDPIFVHLKETLGVTLEKSQKDNWVGDGFNAGSTEYYRLFKDGKPIAFEDMDKIVTLIKKEIIANDFWTKTNPDPQIDNARGTMYTHLIKMRTQEVDNALSIKDGETANIEVRKTDMYDIKKALGLGNDAQCCTALGRDFNEWSAPTYIMNKCIGAIELTDNSSFVGNTMIYLAYVDDKPALVLDNIELKTKYQNNDKIRDTFVDYAKKLCAEIGQPDLPIFAGPNRHKLHMDIYSKDSHTMEIIGNSGGQEVYIDYDAGKHTVGQGEKANIKMYRLR